jgi:hypothetical protein
MTLVLIALIVWFVIGFLRQRPDTIAFASTHTAPVSLTLQTVGSIGFGPNPDWVSYLVKDPSGKWTHSTIWSLPAHTTVNVTVYQFDSASGLRNPFWGQPEGVTNVDLNGRPMAVLNPMDASHTFAVPQLGISVPLKGIADNAPKQCSVAPCPLSDTHNTITFTFKTPGPGYYRWQCFVPCAAGWMFGNGGPMQTVGYMDGALNVR